MSFICPHCSYENIDPSTFCVYCGKKLSTSGANEQATPPSPYGAGTPSSAPQPDEDQDKTISTAKRAAYQVSPAPPNTPQWGESPTPPPPTGNTPAGAPNWGPVPTPHVLPPPDLSTVPPGQQQQWASPPPPPYPAPPMQHPGQQQWAPPPAPSASFSQMGTTTLAAVRNALAGYGTVITHQCWLVEGKQVQGRETLASTVQEQLKQQHYIGSVPQVIRLGEATKTPIEREFLMLQRGSATEFIYVAPVDDALYLSRTTTIQPTLSYIRAGIATILLLVVLGGAVLGGLSGISTATILAVGISLLYSAALFLFFSLLLFSIVSWLQEKDGAKYLRTNRLSDFQSDDVAMLELATDRALRHVINQAGIDPMHITPPAQGYHPRRKIRFI